MQAILAVAALSGCAYPPEDGEPVEPAALVVLVEPKDEFTVRQPSAASSFVAGGAYDFLLSCGGGGEEGAVPATAVPPTRASGRHSMQARTTWSRRTLFGPYPIMYTFTKR